MNIKQDLTGHRFGRLTVTVDSGKRAKKGTIKWSCSCDCGGQTLSRTDALKSGKTQSCGCIQKEKATKTCLARTVHGNCRRKARTVEYRSWEAARQRCDNPLNSDFPDYGGRGIKFCERWKGTNGFSNFLKDMGTKPTSKHSIDRIENNGNYEPDNCHWATATEQQNNTRRSLKFKNFRVSDSKG